MIILNERIKQKSIILLKNEKILYLFLALIILSTFILLQPKLSSKLFPQKRSILLDNFIHSVEKENRIDPVKYWEFREFYSPGYFTFSKTGITDSQSTEFISAIHPQIDQTYIERTFLYYNSPFITSIDSFTETDSFPSIINSHILSQKDIIMRDNTSLLYRNNNDLFIVFLLPIDEMKKANGFFDYREIDKDLVKGKYWLNVTRIKK